MRTISERRGTDLKLFITQKRKIVNMNYEWIKDVITLLPIAGLIWKAATQSAKIKELEEKQKELVNKIDKLGDENEEAIKSILIQLANIQQSIARIETKLEERTR
jgi:hypothetical protein